MFVLIVGSVDMTAYPITKHCYFERRCFIYRLFLLFISTSSFLLFLYTASWKCNRYYLHASMPVKIFCFTLCSILSTRRRNIRLFYIVTMLFYELHTFVPLTQKHFESFKQIDKSESDLKGNPKTLLIWYNSTKPLNDYYCYL